MRRCSKCRSELDPGDRYCGECGHDNGEPDESRAAGPPEKGSRKPSRGLLLVGVLAGVICCVLVVGGYIAVRMLSGIDLTGFENLLDSGDSPPVATIESFSQTSQILDAWIEHNVEFDGQTFMVVHVEFEVLQADAATAAVVVLIYTEDGNPMTAHDPGYELSGQAAVYDIAEVTYSPSTYWDDYELWIPYSAIESGENHYAIVEVQEADTGRILDSWKTDPFFVVP